MNVKKKLFASVLCLLIALAMLPTLALAEDNTEGTATVILYNECDWEDGTGYQMLLDADHDTSGDVMKEASFLCSGDAPEGLYDRFEYKIPGNADGALDTSNVIPYDHYMRIAIPAGTYDYAIVNPTPEDDIIYTANITGNAKPVANDFVFEANKTYIFRVYLTEDEDEYIGDNVDLIVHEHTYADTWDADDSDHWKDCTDAECPDKEGAQLKDSHNFEWKIDKEATDSETGLMHEECTVCGYTRNADTVIDKISGEDNTKPEDKPAATEAAAKPADNPDQPKTGDANTRTLWLVMLFVSASLMFATSAAISKRKENR